MRLVTGNVQCHWWRHCVRWRWVQVEVALEFARAMAYMHSRSPALIHRDLKPANIMIGGSSFMLSDTALLLNSAGIVKVADFGLSKSLPKRGKNSGTGPAGPAAGAAGVASVDDDKGPLNRDTYRLTGALSASAQLLCIRPAQSLARVRSTCAVAMHTLLSAACGVQKDVRWPFLSFAGVARGLLAQVRPTRTEP